MTLHLSTQRYVRTAIGPAALLLALAFTFLTASFATPSANAGNLYSYCGHGDSPRIIITNGFIPPGLRTWVKRRYAGVHVDWYARTPDGRRIGYHVHEYKTLRCSPFGCIRTGKVNKRCGGSISR